MTPPTTATGTLGAAPRLHKALLALCLTLALLVVPRPSQASGIDPGHVALGSTLGSYAVLLASEYAMISTKRACPACSYTAWGVAAVAGLGTMVGPSAGHGYVGEYGHVALWTGLRLVAMTAAVVPIILWVDAGFAVVFPSVILGGGGFVALTVFDIVKAYRMDSPTTTSQRRLQLLPVVAVAPGTHSTTKGLRLSFGF